MTQDELKARLDYNPETGVFTRRTNWGKRFKAGDPAKVFSHPRGYAVISLFGKVHLVHRLAFLWMTGALPQGQIDHINGVRTDNRWCNLREVTQSENNHNIGRPNRRNTSGLLGASQEKRTGKWVGQISVLGKKHHLGTFSTAEKAHAAYLRAKDTLHPTHQRLRKGGVTT